MTPHYVGILRVEVVPSALFPTYPITTSDTISIQVIKTVVTKSYIVVLLGWTSYIVRYPIHRDFFDGPNIQPGSRSRRHLKPLNR